MPDVVQKYRAGFLREMLTIENYIEGIDKFIRKTGKYPIQEDWIEIEPADSENEGGENVKIQNAYINIILRDGKFPGIPEKSSSRAFIDKYFNPILTRENIMAGIAAFAESHKGKLPTLKDTIIIRFIPKKSDSKAKTTTGDMYCEVSVENTRIDWFMREDKINAIGKTTYAKFRDKSNNLSTPAAYDELLTIPNIRESLFQHMEKENRYFIRGKEKIKYGPLKGMTGRQLHHRLVAGNVPGVPRGTTLSTFKKYWLFKPIPAKNIFNMISGMKDRKQGVLPDVMKIPMTKNGYKFGMLCNIFPWGVSGLEKYKLNGGLPETIDDFMRAAFPDDYVSKEAPAADDEAADNPKGP
jgi:hypothetical protein